MQLVLFIQIYNNDTNNYYWYVFKVKICTIRFVTSTAFITLASVFKNKE